MKTVVKTLLWLVVLVAAMAGIARTYVLRAWGQRDEFLRQQVAARLQELFPGAHVALDQVHYDLGRDVTVAGLELMPAEQSLPIVRLPRTVVHIDRDALIDRQQLDVRKVVIEQPTLELIRDRFGQWNWQALLPKTQQGRGSLPEISIEDGTIALRVEQAPGIPAGVLLLEHVDVSLVPSGKRQFVIDAKSRCEHTGAIKLDGRWHVDQQTGQVDGHFHEITVGQELVGVAASFAPDVRTKLEELEAKLREVLSQPPDPRSTSPFNVSLVPEGGAAANPAIRTAPLGAADSILGLKATCNITFRFSRPEPATTPVFKVWLDIAQGEVTNPILPLPLQIVGGKLYADNDRFEVRQLAAQGDNGATKLLIDGELSGREAGYPGRFEIQVANLVCDERLRSRLSAGFGRMYDQHHPRGDVDLHGFVVHDHDGRWRPEGLLLTAKDCSIIHDAFQYPISHVNGTIQQEGSDLVVRMRGMAGGQPITLDGSVIQPGANATLVFDIRGKNLPLDETFLRACKPEIQTTIRNMRLTGVMDGHVRLTKLPQQPLVPRIEATLRDGSLDDEQFRYRIDGLKGKLSALGSFWEFQELSGRHGDAIVTGSGSFTKRQQFGELKLRVAAEHAPLDATLQRALNPTLQKLWDEFSPTGTINVVSDVSWQTNRPAQIRIPKLELSDGSVTLKCLPLRIDQAHGKFAYGLNDQGLPQVTIQSFDGRHGDLRTSIAGFQRFEPDGNWRARFEKFTIEKLTPDLELLTALSGLPGLRQVFESLDSKQTLDMDGVLELRGTPDPADAITAFWDIDTQFSGGTMHTGLDFKDLHGKVAASGTWDGEQADIRGFVDLQSAKILDYSLSEVRGPFRVHKGVLMFGAGDTQRARPQKAPETNERLVAKLFDGLIILDGAATLNQTPEYQINLQLQNCKLERFAALHAPKQRNLRGFANGTIGLRGKGSSPRDVVGKGVVQIHPAALLDLPVMLQIYQNLKLAPHDQSTFQYALFNFDIRNAAFVFNDFNGIVLSGDTISFRGRGSVGFDTTAKLLFVSELSRNQVPIPLINDVLGEATKGWVGIDVRGKLSNPKIEVKPVPLLDDAMKNFLSVFPQPVLPIGQGLRPRVNRQ